MKILDQQYFPKPMKIGSICTIFHKTSNEKYTDYVRLKIIGYCACAPSIKNNQRGCNTCYNNGQEYVIHRERDGRQKEICAGNDETQWEWREDGNA